MAWWHYIKGNKLPTPGAMVYALADCRLFPNNAIGPAIGQRQYLRTINQQVMFTGMKAVTGVGGLASGAMVLQPLSDPYNGGS